MSSFAVKCPPIDVFPPTNNMLLIEVSDKTTKFEPIDTSPTTESLPVNPKLDEAKTLRVKILSTDAPAPAFRKAHSPSLSIKIFATIVLPEPIFPSTSMPLPLYVSTTAPPPTLSVTTLSLTLRSSEFTEVVVPVTTKLVALICPTFNILEASMVTLPPM